MVRGSYNSVNRSNARFLRNNSTPGEIALWKYLKGKQLLGFKFRRQHPVSHYILDFYCSEIKLAIEIDGSSHDDRKWDYDRKRENHLLEMGVKTIRFTEFDTYTRTINVVNTITNYILDQNK